MAGKAALSAQDLNKLLHYATFESFRPITSQGKEKKNRRFDDIWRYKEDYDKAFKSLSESECKAIFERLAEEYTVVMNETEKCKKIAENKSLITEKDLRITGREVEYKNFFSLMNIKLVSLTIWVKGHRVILANPGAGKKVYCYCRKHSNTRVFTKIPMYY
ncbi:MAG: hypothetical protein L6V84_05920 [Oscillospiraceae bacterium]|nr:MAG: hypothetical protein L6V84_05920 [Oscillospiraceae bacterium]